MNKFEFKKFAQKQIEQNLDLFENDLILLTGSIFFKHDNDTFNDFFNGKKDVDILLIRTDEDFDVSLEPFLCEYNIDIVTKTIKYGAGRNSINVKILKKSSLINILNFNQISFTSYRKNSLKKFKPTTSFFGNTTKNREEISFDYNEIATSNGCFIKYHFNPFKSYVYYLSDLHSMFLFCEILNQDQKMLSIIKKFQKDLLLIIMTSPIERINSLFKYFVDKHSITPMEILLKLLRDYSSINILINTAEFTIDFYFYFRIIKTNLDYLQKSFGLLIDDLNYINIDFLKQQFNSVSSVYTHINDTVWLDTLRTTTVTEVKGGLNIADLLSHAVQNSIVKDKKEITYTITDFDILFEKNIKTSFFFNYSIHANTCDLDLIKFFLKAKDSDIDFLQNQFLGKTRKIASIEDKYKIVWELLKFLIGESFDQNSKLKEFHINNLKEYIVISTVKGVELINLLSHNSRLNLSKKKLRAMFHDNAVKIYPELEIVNESFVINKNTDIQIGKGKVVEIEVLSEKRS